MKRKIIYMLVLVSCMSFLSSAKQSDKNCNKKTKYTKQIKASEVKGTGFDLSPLHLFIFSI
jgi:hypothetical protein